MQTLQDGLPEDYEVFHGVNWSAVHAQVQWFGEIDAIVLAPNGNLVLLEIKAGPVEMTDHAMVKHYGDRTKDVNAQTRRQYAAMRERLKQCGLSGVHLGQLLILPDATITDGTVAFPRERIVDAAQMHMLCRHVMEAVPSQASHAPDHEKLRRFLLDRFNLAPDPTARIGLVQRAVTALSADGLARWVPRIHHPAGVYSVQATAGSGKTQLALRLLQDAAPRRQPSRRGAG